MKAAQVAIWISERGEDWVLKRHYDPESPIDYAGKRVEEIAAEPVMLDKCGREERGGKEVWCCVYRTKGGRVFDVWEKKEVS